jgi:DegV family protein with EDD domain
MSKIALLTDSTCDLPLEIIKKYCVNVIPLRVVYKDREYWDGVEITPDEVYRTMSRETPKTSLPSSGHTLELIKGLKAKGYTDVLAIHISGGLSGTLSMMEGLKDKVAQLGISLHVVDSKALSMGLGFLVIKAGQMISENLPVNEVLKKVNGFRDEIKVFFVLKTLEYLRKGGRIGMVEGTVGDLLDIKPIISINEQGIYYTVAKARGRRGSLGKVADMVKKAIGDKKVRLAVMHGAAPDEARDLLAKIREQINAVEVFSGQIGPVMGVHTGPGLIGVVFCPE